jgi:hypothetical protein
MRLKLTFANATGWVVGVLLAFGSVSARAEADGIKVEAQLIWATNDKEDPNPKHKPVAPEIREKINQLPLKWANYFEVKNVPLEIPKGEVRVAKLSEKCAVEIKNLEGGKIEVALMGKGDPVWKRVQTLPKGDVLILGGNAPNATAWFVAVKRIK